MIESVLSWICFIFALPVGLVLVLKPSVIAKKTGDPVQQKKVELPIRIVGVFFIGLALVCLL